MSNLRSFKSTTIWWCCLVVAELSAAKPVDVRGSSRALYLNSTKITTSSSFGVPTLSGSILPASLLMTIKSAPGLKPIQTLSPSTSLETRPPSAATSSATSWITSLSNGTTKSISTRSGNIPAPLSHTGFVNITTRPYHANLTPSITRQSNGSNCQLDGLECDSGPTPIPTDTLGASARASLSRARDPACAASYSRSRQSTNSIVTNGSPILSYTITDGLKSEGIHSHSSIDAARSKGPCCNGCGIVYPSVRVYEFPQRSPSSTTSVVTSPITSYASPSPAPPLNESYLVEPNFNWHSPFTYVVFDRVFATDGCGYQIGSSHTTITMTFASGELSIMTGLGSGQSQPSATGIISAANLTAPSEPLIAFATQLVGVDPAWSAASCTGNPWQRIDALRILSHYKQYAAVAMKHTVVSGIEAATTMRLNEKAESTPASPVSGLGLLPNPTTFLLLPSAPSDPPARRPLPNTHRVVVHMSVASLDAVAGVITHPAGTARTPAFAAQQSVLPTPLSNNIPVPPAATPEPVLASTVPSRGPTSVPMIASIIAEVGSTKADQALATSSVTPAKVPLIPAVVVQGQTVKQDAAPTMIGSHTVVYSAGFLHVGSTAVSIVATMETLPPQRVSQPQSVVLEGLTFVALQSNTQAASGPATTQPLPAVDPERALSVGEIAAAAQAEAVRDQRNPASLSAVIAQGHTIIAGAPPVIIDSNTVAYRQGTVYVNGKAAPAPTPVPQANSMSILGGLTFSRAPPSTTARDPVSPTILGGVTAAAQNSKVVIGSVTVGSGAAPVTIDGTAVSLGPSGLVVGSITYGINALSRPTSQVMAIVGGQTVVLGPGGVVIGRSTLQPGARATTISGTPISVGVTNLVVGTRTIALPSFADVAVVTSGTQPLAARPTDIPIAATTLSSGRLETVISDIPGSIGSWTLLSGTSTSSGTKTSPSVITIGGQTFTAVISGSDIAEITLLSGGPSTIISGTPASTPLFNPAFNASTSVLPTTISSQAPKLPVIFTGAVAKIRPSMSSSFLIYVLLHGILWHTFAVFGIVTLM